MRGNLFLINLGFNLVYFTTINSDVPLTRTAKELHNCMPSNIVKVPSQKFFSNGAPWYAVSTLHVRRHHMAELLVTIKV